MFTLPDETMLDGEWGIMKTDTDDPFVIGDAPAVTFERTEENRLYWGIGFARPNVEVYPAASPAYQAGAPAVADRGDMAQAPFATDYCFANVNSRR